MQVLSQTDVYQTAERKLSWFFMRFPSFFYYFQLLSMLLGKNRRLSHSLYSDEEYLNDTFNITGYLENVGVRFHCEGLHIPKETQGPCIFVANHMSTLETFILSTMILPYGKMTYVVKESLLNYPVFKNFLRDRNPIAVTRKSPKDDFKTVIEEGKKRIEDNISVIVFPQTTRSMDITLAQFNTIGVKLAEKTNVPIVPIALKTDAWGNGKRIKDFGRIDPSKTVHIKFGEPLIINHNAKKIHEQIKEFIRSNLIEWTNKESAQ